MLGLRRSLPADLRMRIGSQWWYLRRKTVEAILDFLKNRPEVLIFLKRLGSQMNPSFKPWLDILSLAKKSERAR